MSIFAQLDPQYSYRSLYPLLLFLVFLIPALPRFFRSSSKSENQAREPPDIPQTIPYIGHVLGMLQHGLRYFDIISARHNLPIFTLRLLKSKLYVVTSPYLVQEIQRNTTTVSFSPAILPAIKRLLGFDDTSMAILSLKSEDNDSFFGEIHKVQRASLGLGTTSLDELSRSIRGHSLDSLNSTPNGQEVDLFAWLRHVLTISNTTACFGPMNPFSSDPELEGVLW
jgi:hypothetical protein